MNRISRHNGNSTDMTVLERQQLQQERKQSYLQDTHFSLSHFPLENPPMEENGWQGFVNYPLPRTGFDVQKMGFLSNEPAISNFSISRPSTCSPVVGLADKLPLSVGTEKKRKSDKNVGREEANGKKIKKEAEEVASKQTEQTTTTTTTTTNNNNHDREASADVSKVSEVQKQDFIHVRARRGQATDSHSLAERVRREKISERMRYLQDLVPGCNKIIGKAGMLDEIINYVQSLQRQVEFLSMKLATVTPQIDSNINDFVAKEIYQSCANSFPEIGMLPEVVNPPYYQFNPTCGGLDMEINHTEMSLGRTNSSPVSVPEEFLDSSCFPQTQLSIWENDLQSIYNIGLGCQDRSTAFLSEPFAGNQSASNLKMEI